MVKLALDEITIDPRPQPREMLDQGTVREYAEAMREGAVFPPVRVFCDGSKHWLSRGYHRYFAAKNLGLPDIEADIRPGTVRDAILDAVSDNDAHGLRRSNEDKRIAVLKLLQDPEWSQWSDGEIARRCKVSQPFVSGLRRELEAAVERLAAARSRTFVHPRSGRPVQMDTANIGKRSGNKDDAGAPRHAGSGVREKEEPQRDLRLGATLMSIRSAMGAVPPPAAAARLARDFPLAEAERIGLWWTDFAEELRDRAERAA